MPQSINDMIPSVKKFLVIFMLLILSFQMSWAAAATYCQHEKEITTAHFGHHEHEHPQAQDGNDLDGSSMNLHPDCFNCQGTPAGVAITSQSPQFVTFSSIAVAPPDTSFLASALPNRPERPKWALAI